ncbi:ABC transporter permease [Eubacterium sp. AF15-50]|uniref:ABC transporter permease n=1 Tax=Eubacterium sp. AF15-50 TaxID=2293103 RepID=UPI0026728400|nr:ABC transporter permease [Eubacterium sp. AF15-50]
MFLHNLKYTIKTLFKNKILIFWTFAFPIILGIFFNMAFSNIEKDEKLKVFDIAVVNDSQFENQKIYQEALKELSADDSENKLFNIKYVKKEKADSLLDDSDIEGYIIFKNEEPQVVVKKNGTYQTLIRFVVTEIGQNKAIIEDLTKKTVENEIAKGSTSFDPEKIAKDILEKINNGQVNMKNISASNLSYMQIEFYTLIAMTCMYCGMLGLTAINNCLANMSSKGKRISVSPNKKSIIVLSSAIGSYLVSMVGIAILILFLRFVLKVDFGDNTPLVILLSAVGDLAGISMGVLIASVFRMSEGAKTGITIAITMFLSVLSGMMGVTLKYVIDKNVPVINLINPNNLITDGFYSLYYYDTLDRYLRDVTYLLVFVVICLTISFISLRREKYDSI